MANKHLLMEPHKIRVSDCIGSMKNDDAWWYEEPKGLCVVLNGNGQFYIRWSALKNALKRKEAP